MIYLYSFLFAGLICMIAQIILDHTKLTPGHITSIFVVIGTCLDTFSFYDKIIAYVGGGALVPITSFGHLLMHGAMAKAVDYGWIGLATGMFDFSAAGVVSAIVFTFLFSLIFKPKN